ncbi:hypothetical protein AVL50_25350 [Flammeovirga sp. SJP92]|nr:hypothetical protein AVL50_25350 [Flammeovirga sp. SJP92]
MEMSPKFEKELINNVIESLYASGVFTEDDIKDKESYISGLKRIIDNGIVDGITIVTDHTESLTLKARECQKAKEFDYARIFYATFFEHKVNDLISLYCIRNGIDLKTQISIIKSVNILGKFTWLLELMKYPKFNKKHLSTILKLADSRNSFVHYKWKEDPELNNEIDWDKEKLRIDSEFENIEKTVKYFKNYCSKLKFKGKKGQIKKIVK